VFEGRVTSPGGMEDPPLKGEFPVPRGQFPAPPRNGVATSLSPFQSHSQWR
jgi:hypothetical protein